MNGLASLLVDLKLSLEMIQSFSFFQKQKQRLDRYEQLILDYTMRKEDQIFHRRKPSSSQRTSDTTQASKTEATGNDVSNDVQDPLGNQETGEHGQASQSKV